ncbi:MAG TPA: amidohydrolase family protein [Candidatus Methylomirabilis sp.]|nr:amidohydrolase family protein [Candidatus Methylomirabilis sp.]
MPDTPGVDCHAHVIDPRRFPYSQGPGYMPRADETGDGEAFARVLAAHGITHALLVQPSCYGEENACMLEAMGRSGGKIKGIAVISPSASDAEMTALKDRGVVGIRLNLMRSDRLALTRPGAERYLSRVAALGWFVQVYATGDVWAEAAPALRRCGARLIVDHFGEPDASRGIDQPGFAAVLGLGRETDAAVKLSASFRASLHPYPHEDVEPFVAAIVGAYGVDRCLWGSDWPFINTAQQVEYGNLLRLLGRWLPSPADRQRVLWENPARLFGFARGR